MRIISLLLIALPLYVLAQAPPPPPAGQKGGARPAPKNLKILKPEEVRAKMNEYRIALGAQCTMCHEQGDFASDAKPEKETARMMIAMTKEINAKIAGEHEADHDHVTCFTCHRGGEHHPKTAPEAAAPATPPAP
jgi:hypothetical protein